MSCKKGSVAWNKGLKGYKHSGSFKVGHKTLLNKDSLVKISKSLMGHPFYGKKHHTQEELLKMKGRVSWNKGKRMDKISGSNHWNWQGGRTAVEKSVRMTLEHKIWSREVRERDGWCCRTCGYRGKNLVAHHLKLFQDFPELRFAVENGIALCRKCHIEIHRPHSPKD